MRMGTFSSSQVPPEGFILEPTFRAFTPKVPSLFQYEALHITFDGDFLIPLDNPTRPLERGYFIHKYKVDKETPIWLKAFRPIIML